MRPHAQHLKKKTPEADISAVRLCVICLLVEHSMCSPRLLQWQAVMCRRTFHKQISNLMCQAQAGPVLCTISEDGESNYCMGGGAGVAPALLPAVLMLLRTKSREVVKSVLGFVKVDSPRHSLRSAPALPQPRPLHQPGVQCPFTSLQDRVIRPVGISILVAPR